MNPDDLVRLAHNIDLPFAAGKAPPSEFRIFAAGKVETTKGNFLFDAESATAVMADVAEWGNEYPIDYDHGMLSAFALDPAHASRAAGWFTPAIRNGELWATNATWTPTAAKMLADREYRYVSPAFPPPKDKENRITSLINVAITNLPATKRSTPLMASRAGDPGMESKMKTIAVALSLAAEATEAEVLAAVTALQGFAARVLSEAGAKTQAEALGVLAGWKGNAARVAELTAKVAGFEAAQTEAETEKLIAEGKTAGKITPSSEPQVRQLAKAHGVDWLKGLLAVALSAPKPLEEPAGGSGGGVVTLDAKELAYAEKHKIDPKVMLETKKSAIAAGTYPG